MGILMVPFLRCLQLCQFLARGAPGHYRSVVSYVAMILIFDVALVCGFDVVNRGEQSLVQRGR